MMVLVIDGQGGRIGRSIVEQLRAADFSGTVIAVGTNTTATAAVSHRAKRVNMEKAFSAHSSCAPPERWIIPSRIRSLTFPTGRS